LQKKKGMQGCAYHPQEHTGSSTEEERWGVHTTLKDHSLGLVYFNELTAHM